MGDISVSKKLFVLVMLVIQNASQTLLMRYSVGVLREEYSKMSVVMVTEFIKFVSCSIAISLAYGDSSLNKYTEKTIVFKIFYLIRYSGYSWVPAFCYFLQNNLTYYASQNLSSPVFAVLQQLKIFSAAIFSVTLLGRHLTYRQWRALALLVLGAVLMEYHTFEIDYRPDIDRPNVTDPIKGLVFMLIIVTLSGVAGVITEKLMKSKDINVTGTGSLNINRFSIWDRNIQLSVWSVVFGVIGIMMDKLWYTNNMNQNNSNSIFYGWSMITFFVSLLMACGGLLVALTLKYTDVVVKGFASAISLICICIGGNFFLNDYLDMIFMIGACVTVLASFNYNDKEMGKSVLASSSKSMFDEDKKSDQDPTPEDLLGQLNRHRMNDNVVVVNEDEIEPMLSRTV